MLFTINYNKIFENIFKTLLQRCLFSSINNKTITLIENKQYFMARIKQAIDVHSNTMDK